MAFVATFDSLNRSWQGCLCAGSAAGTYVVVCQGPVYYIYFIINQI